LSEDQNIKTRAGYVAIIGKPNAGKSTLMNSLIGAKLSIVTPKPQTTRKRVLGIYSEGDTQIVFLDTPGMLAPKYELQRQMMDYVSSAIEESDAIAVIISAEKFTTAEEYFPKKFLEMLSGIKKPKIAVINKLDLLPQAKFVLPIIAELSMLGLFDDIIPISALKNAQTDELIRSLEKHIPESPFFYDAEMLSTQSQRFFVSEIIREQIFLDFREEIPYSTEVQITEFKERSNGKWYIAADIIVERQPQKVILVGADGAQIKRIGEYARRGIEEHLQTEVFLELFVKVRNKWREDKNMLKNMGY
jgi:GTP-binding protein Era